MLQKRRRHFQPIWQQCTATLQQISVLRCFRHFLLHYCLCSSSSSFFLIMALRCYRYFGRKQVNPGKEEAVENIRNLVVADYSYWTLSYAISQQGAQKLLNAEPLSKMLPVDEFLPIMYDKHPKYVWQQRWIHQQEFAHLLYLCMHTSFFSCSSLWSWWISSIIFTFYDFYDKLFQHSTTSFCFQTYKAKTYLIIAKNILPYGRLNFYTHYIFRLVVFLDFFLLDLSLLFTSTSFFEKKVHFGHNLYSCQFNM